MSTGLKESRRSGAKAPDLDDGRPQGPILQIDNPGAGAAVYGLSPLCGWAITNERLDPEGTVELSFDDENDWVELTSRMRVSGIDAGAEWAARGGFQASINTFLLTNGPHTIRLRVKDSDGDVAMGRDLPVRVDNVGRLAETTARLLKGHGKAKRIWTGVIDSEDFPYEAGRDVAWFDRPDAESQIAGVLKRHGVDARFEAHFRKFIREGYLVLEDFVPRKWCQRINNDVDRLLRDGVLATPPAKGQRVEKAYVHSKSARDLWEHPEILKILSAVYDDVALPCQTLNFLHGSQQGVHQDLVHLTPFPAGMMCGVWVALEDIHPDAGPLVIYPGSHRLERLYTRTVPVKKVDDGDWKAFADVYTPRLLGLIEAAGLKPEYYTPKAGSVLIWHENLAHGGSTRKNDEITRKSMVSHYFARGGMAFYDSQGLPGWTHED